MKVLDTENYLINPYTAIRLFARTYLNIGNVLLKNRDYKLTREAWITAMYLIALTKNYHQEWWLSPVTDNTGSPDFYCYKLAKSKTLHGVEKQRLKLEVFEWRKVNPSEDFISALKRIKLRKIIDPEITLVCMIRVNGKISSAVDLNQELIKINPKVKDIWYLAAIDSDEKMWRVTQIYPNLVVIDIDYDEILSTREKQSFLHTYRGTSNGIIYEHTDQQILLTPKFDIEIVEK